MVDMSNLWNMQGMMFLMVLTGMIFSKIGVITKEGRSCLTKLTINLFIPCNMVAAFLNADHSMLFQMAEIMLISFVIQIAQYILSKILFRKMGPAGAGGYALQHDGIECRFPRQSDDPGHVR